MTRYPIREALVTVALAAIPLTMAALLILTEAAR